MDAIDFRAHRGVANVGMNKISKVDRCRAARERYEHPLRRETEHLILIEVKFGMLIKFFRILSSL